MFSRVKETFTTQKLYTSKLVQLFINTTMNGDNYTLTLYLKSLIVVFLSNKSGNASMHSNSE